MTILEELKFFGQICLATHKIWDIYFNNNLITLIRDNEFKHSIWYIS